jgi:hypothetical protein
LKWEAIPHSHPQLTLNTRHYEDLSCCFPPLSTSNTTGTKRRIQKQTAKAIAELRKAYRAVPVGGLDGVSDEENLYLHIIVCYGEERARHLIEFWANDYYRKIYALILANEEAVGKVVSATRAVAEALMANHTSY